MKKRIIIVFILMSFILTGCNLGQKTDIRTLAYPLGTEQINKEKLTMNGDYNFENVLAYTFLQGKTKLTIFSAPIENSKNVIIPLKNEVYTSIKSYINKQLPEIWSSENPIKISGIGEFLELYPTDEKEYISEHKTSVNAFGQKRDSVVYKDVFGAGNDLICYLTSFGINTEIVLNKPPEYNIFQFQIKIYSAVVDPESPDYTLFRTVTDNEEIGDIKSIVYTPLAVSQNKNWCYDNQVQIEQDAHYDYIYIVKFIIDEDFLQTESTKYPVLLNQSFHLSKSKQPDTSVYKNTGDTLKHYLSPYLLLGESNSKGEGWTYIRYETLDLMNIPEDKIESANYVFHNLFDLTEEVKISAYAVTSDWCSINTRWYNRPNFDEKPLAQTIVKQSGDYAIDITSLFREMIKNKQNPDAIYSIWHGFMIKCDTSGKSLILASGDNGLFSPCLEVIIGS